MSKIMEKLINWLLGGNLERLGDVIAGGAEE